MNVGDEALLVLQLHRVEDAAVGVDADEEFVFGREGNMENQCGRLRGECGTAKSRERLDRPRENQHFTGGRRLVEYEQRPRADGA